MKRRNVPELDRMLTCHFPMNKAVVCMDCSSISDGNRECPACTSKALMNLSRVLNPTERPQLPAVAQIDIPVAA